MSTTAAPNTNSVNRYRILDVIFTEQRINGRLQNQCCPVRLFRKLYPRVNVDSIQIITTGNELQDRREINYIIRNM